MRATSDSARRDSVVPACDLLSIPAPERAAHIDLARSLLFREGQRLSESAGELTFEVPAARVGVAPSQEVPAVRDLGEERA